MFLNVIQLSRDIKKFNLLMYTKNENQKLNFELFYTTLRTDALFKPNEKISGYY